MVGIQCFYKGVKKHVLRELKSTYFELQGEGIVQSIACIPNWMLQHVIKQPFLMYIYQFSGRMIQLSMIAIYIIMCCFLGSWEYDKKQAGIQTMKKNPFLSGGGPQIPCLFPLLQTVRRCNHMLTLSRPHCYSERRMNILQISLHSIEVSKGHCRLN